jgi:C-terminal processing protease CtpA/Prc
MKLVVKGPNDTEVRQLDVQSKVTQQKRIIDLTRDFDLNDLLREIEDESRAKYHRFQKVGNTVVWKMPGFDFVPEQVESLISNRIRGSSALILDLRGNPGGYIVTLEKLVSYLFDTDIKIAQLKGRKEMKPLQSKAQGNNGFNGKLIVLVDSQSASCSEVLARLVQLEKRGIVIGDKSSGAVMQSILHNQEMGVDKLVLYGVSITNADLIMSDGKSLEHLGVIPDELLLPGAADLANNRDPVLARALELTGSLVTPEQAGKFFPIEWEK